MIPWFVLLASVVATVLFFVEEQRYYRRRAECPKNEGDPYSRGRAVLTLACLILISIGFAYAIVTIAERSRYF